jgi:nicotinate-nucleotide pyrophosphorylase (carboxylating)
MMNKNQIILKYFQKKDELSTGNKDYKLALVSLFRWLIRSDDSANDITTRHLTLPLQSHAVIICKENGIVVGLEEISFLLKKFTKLSFTPKTQDGKKVKMNETIADISGNTNEILGYERMILNILQRMSGIATQTNMFIHSINRQPTTDNRQPYLASTRKTPWMWLDKNAVAVGGGLTHRLSLSDGILFKDNHMVAIKSQFALKNNKEAIIKSLELTVPELNNQLIEIEVEKIEEAIAAASIFNKLNNHSNHLAILLDNFNPVEIKKTLKIIDQQQNSKEIIFEASGGIDGKNIHEYASSGVNIISVGSLTHSAYSLNISLEIV